MHRAIARLCTTCLLVALAACSEDVLLPADGTPSTLNVRVYVDQDGDGAYASGSDAPIAGAEVTATSEGSALSATSDNDGLAVFQNVQPGSYVLAHTATPPTGAVLASASRPAVVAPFRGGTVEAEFRYSLFPGILSGVVFRDDDASGAYEPGQDTPAPGVDLALVSAAGDTVATATTDNDGAFTMVGLRPSTYTLEIAPFAGLTFVGGLSQTVTVGSATPTTFNIEFQGNLTPITIASARGMAGATVLVEGVVTWQQEWDPTVYFLQDATGGISTFDTNDPTLQRGDRIRLRGVIGAFRGETQMSPVLSISVTGQEAVPTPRTVTATQVNAGQFQGQLVRIVGTVDSLQVFSFDNHMVFLTDAGGTTVTAFVDSRNGVGSADWTVGSTVAVVGVLGTDDRNTLAFRIELRDAADRTELTPPVTIAAARATAPGNTVTVEGVVTWQQQWDPSVYFFQDASGGISAFDTNDPTLQRGDRIRIRGVVGAFRGETQLSPIVSIAVLRQEALPTPRAVTGAQINGAQFQGELATIDGTVDSLQVFSFDNHMVFLTDGSGTIFTAFVDSRNGIASTDWTVGQTMTLQGVLGTDDRNTLAARLELRDPNDMISGPAPITISAARGMAAGATVTVEGVVTWQQEWDASVYFYQDVTGGISTFDTNDPSLQRGDRIRIQGVVGAFRGETQLSSIVSITVLGQEALPAPRAVSGAAVNAGQFQGELAAIAGTVDSLQVFSFDNHMVFLTDASGTVFTAFVDSRNGIASTDWTVGEAVTLVGVLGTDDRNTLAARLELRDPSDKQ